MIEHIYTSRIQVIYIILGYREGLVTEHMQVPVLAPGLVTHCIIEQFSYLFLGIDFLGFLELVDGVLWVFLPR